MEEGVGTQVSTGSDNINDVDEVQPVEIEQETDGLSNPFLSNIPEEDREIVGKYAKQWDAGVTRRFQEIHQQYNPYKELGEVEELEKSLKIAQYIRENPEELYSILHEQYGSKPQQPTQPIVPMPGTQNPSYELPEELAPLAQMLKQQEEQYGSRFTEYETKIGNFEKTLNIVAEYVVKQLESSAQEKEDQELNTYMENLHTEFGDFDDDYVLTKISAGVKPDVAVKAYKTAIQQQVNASRKPDPGVPAVLSGGGGVPQTGRKPEELSPQETRELVANVLAQAHRQ